MESAPSAKGFRKRTLRQRAIVQAQFIETLQSELEKLHGALLQYARRDNWSIPAVPSPGVCPEWYGPGNGPDLARKALGFDKPTDTEPTKP